MLTDNDVVVISAHDLPIVQWYDVMRWWVYPHPERVLDPAVKWACEQRASELPELLELLRR